MTVLRRNRKKRLELQGAAWMTLGGEVLGGEQRMGLLRAIAEQGSITHAALAVGLSLLGACAQTPTAPPSVGVATPKKIDARTARMSANGTPAATAASFHALTDALAASIKGGARPGRHRVAATTYTRYSPTSIALGSRAAWNISTSGTSICSASTMSTRLGGSICASVPAAAIEPVASLGS